jgi:2'-5' RNA ligase
LGIKTMAVRTFLALPLAEGIVAGLLEARRELMDAGGHVRWVSGQNLHLTVKFLGAVEDRDLSEVCRLAEQAASQVEPFKFVVKGLSAVPPAGQMRMVWCGVEEPTGRLARLAELAEQAYVGMGFKGENRRFRPHLTLGRVKTGRNVAQLREAVARFAHTDFGTQPADELIVMSSQLTPDGPVYSPLATARLGGA